MKTTTRHRTQRLLQHTWTLCLLGLVLAFGTQQRAVAQSSGMFTSEQQPIRITLTPAFQWYQNDGIGVQEGSVRLQGFVPITDRWQVRAGLQMATAQVDEGPSLTGLDDVELGALYMRPLGSGSIVFRVDASLPTGTEELTLDELQTAGAISQSVYGFRVPGFGQGLSVKPRVTWAIPLSERVVAGAGVSYSFRGSYRPFAAMVRTYDPGDAAEVFGGIDVTLSEQSGVAVDLRYARYTTDQLGDVDRLQAGDLAAGTLQYRYQLENGTLRVTAFYQSWSESNVFPRIVNASNTGDPRRRQLTPSYSVLQAAYQTELWGTQMAFRAEGRRYGETIVVDSQTLFLLGMRPSFEISDLGEGIELTPQVIGTLGSVMGIDVGLQTSWRF